MTEKYIEDLMGEVDANVRELIDVFRFTLKYKVLFRGSGIEFSGLREYVPQQDDATKIDWKASLRSKKLYVKQYEEERELDAYILLDTSSSMLFGTQEKLKSEYASVVVGAIAYAAIESGDNVGFGMFSDRIITSLQPSGDSSQYYKILRLVVDPRFYGSTCNLEGALSYVVNCIEGKTILFIISDFIGIGDNWKDSLKMACGKFTTVIGIMIRDIRDSYLPKGIGKMRFSDPFSDDMLTVNVDKIADKFEKQARQEEAGIENEFRDGGAGFVKVYTAETFVRPLVDYLQLKETGI